MEDVVKAYLQLVKVHWIKPEVKWSSHEQTETYAWRVALITVQKF